MQPSRSVRLVLFGAALVAAACAGAGGPPTEPQAPSFSTGAVVSPTLLVCTPLPPETATAFFTKEGGILRIGPHTLLVPKSAVKDTVTISAEIVAGVANAVRFSPQGYEFKKGGAVLTLSYDNCSGPGMLDPKAIAYTDDAFNILYLIASADLVSQHTVTAAIQHFSQYAVAY